MTYPQTTPLSDDIDQLAARVAAAAGEQAAAGEVIGLTWAIGLGGEVRCGAAGQLDADGTRPAAVDTIYRISSTSKPITAAAAMVAIDDGLFGPDDPVDALLPELAGRRVLVRPDGPLTDTVPADRPITVEDLLSFRSGLGIDFTAWDPTPLSEAIDALGLGVGPPAPQVPPAPDEWLARIGSVPLRNQPGQRWLYHTSAQILGVLIARATGESLPQWMSRRIFEPLGMADTAFFVPAGKADRFGACFGSDPATGRTTVYDPPEGQWSRPPAFPGGGDGLVSTAGDVHRFAAMMLSGGLAPSGDRVLSRASVAAMTTNRLTATQLREHAPGPDGTMGWGYGLSVLLDATGPFSAGSYGWDGGLGTVWRNDPRRGLIAVLLTNRMWSAPFPPPAEVSAFLRALAPTSSDEQ